MFLKSPIPAMALTFAMVFGLPLGPVHAQDAEYQEAALDQRDDFSTEELDQILAPIALYPDDLLSNVLMASTYPLEVVEAARWIEEPENADLKNDALLEALQNKDWAPSVKSLTQFPDVLFRMSENIDWMRTLGDAVLADQAAVMDRIQFLRTKADEAGNLESNEHQKVEVRREENTRYIYIEPAEPDVVYVPVYEPDRVYGSWWYDDYPPYYWDVGFGYSGFFYWGTGVAIVPRLWRWSSPRWHRHYIHVFPRRYNRLARHKLRRGHHRWRHNARHRRGVRYHNRRLRRLHQRNNIRGARAYRNFDRKKLRGERRLKATRDGRRLRARREGRQNVIERRFQKLGNTRNNPRAEDKKRFSRDRDRPGGNSVKRNRIREIQKGRTSAKKRAIKRRSGIKKKQRAVKKRSPAVKKKRAGQRKVQKRRAVKKRAVKKRRAIKRGKGRKVRARRGGRKAGARRGGGRKGGRRGGGRGKGKGKRR